MKFLAAGCWFDSPVVHFFSSLFPPCHALSFAYSIRYYGTGCVTARHGRYIHVFREKYKRCVLLRLICRLKCWYNYNGRFQRLGLHILVRNILLIMDKILHNNYVVFILTSNVGYKGYTDNTQRICKVHLLCNCAQIMP